MYMYFLLNNSGSQSQALVFPSLQVLLGAMVMAAQMDRTPESQVDRFGRTGLPTRSTDGDPQNPMGFPMHFPS